MCGVWLFLNVFIFAIPFLFILCFFFQSHELVDIIAKVLKSNCSIEELDFYECRLSKYVLLLSSQFF